MVRRRIAGTALLAGLMFFSVKAGSIVAVNLIRPDWVCNGEAEYFDQQYIGKYTTAPDGNPWNKQFLGDMSIYHCIRFMDWLQTITVTDVSWATRTQKNGANQKLVAYEWAVDLCNRVNADFWLNVPHMADSVYCTNLGELVGGLLNANLKVYLEYSNETWWEGNCYNYIAGVGNSLGINNQVKDSTGKIVYGRQDWTGNAYLAAKMWKWFKNGFNAAGKDTTRCVNVLCGQSGYGNAEDAHYMLEALKTVKVNPYGQKCNVFALAPYWTTGSPLKPMGDLDNALKWTKPNNVALACYEGGHDDNVETQALYNDYITHLDAVNKRLDGPFCQFGHIGTGCRVQWGAKKTTSEPNDSAWIYRALRDWSLAHPITVAVAPYRAFNPTAAARSVHPLFNVKLYGLNGGSIGAKKELRGTGCYIAVTPDRGACMILNMGK